jgi:hypothetical protein
MASSSASNQLAASENQMKTTAAQCQRQLAAALGHILSVRLMRDVMASCRRSKAAENGEKRGESGESLRRNVAA